MKTKITQLSLLMAFLLMPFISKAQWSHVRYDLSNSFSKVFTEAADTAFAIGIEPVNGENFMVRTNNGGITWDSINMSTNSPLQLSQLFFVDNNNGFTGGYKNNGSQVLLKTSDNGTNWTEITPEPLSTEAINAIYFLDDQHGFVSSYSKIYSTLDGGNTWATHQVSFIATDLHFTDMSNGIASGSDGSNFAVMMKTTDGGQTWTSTLNANDPNLFVSNFIKENIVNADVTFTAMQYTNKLFRTLDNGLTWTTIVVDSVFSIHDFHFTSALSGHVLSDYGQIYVTEDGGASWALEYATDWGFYGPSIMLYSFSFVGNGASEIGYVGGSSGLIKKHEIATAIQETTTTNNISIYPNPLSASQDLLLQTKNFQGSGNVEIKNVSGEIVFAKQVEFNSINSSITLSGLNLSSGIYFVTAETNTNRSTQKLLVTE